MAVKKKKTQYQVLVPDVEHQEISYIAGENAKSHSHFGETFGHVL